jgi:hypothetical protein
MPGSMRGIVLSFKDLPIGEGRVIGRLERSCGRYTHVAKCKHDSATVEDGKMG